jgi:hypothetical protein
VPTLPLFDDRVTTADGAHRVRAPGGYESWRFAAYDFSSQTAVSVCFSQGSPSRTYLRRYLRFRARPTRHAPPLPQEYPAVSVSIYSHGRFTTSTLRFQASDFAADPGVRVGPHRFYRDGDGSIHMAAPGIDLMFRPLCSREPIEQSVGPADTTHRWKFVDGLCECRGVVDVGQGKVKFAGQGVHDQVFGDAPNLCSTVCGQGFFKDRALVLHQSQTDALHIASLGRDSISIESDRAAHASRALTGWGISHPRTVTLSNGVVIDRARVLRSDFYGASVMYHCEWFGETGVVFCEIGELRRMAWTAFGA